MRPMKLLSRSSMGLAVSMAALLSSSVQRVTASGHLADYDGTLCNGFIDYKVWLPDGATVDMVEQELIAQGLQQISALVDPCKSTFIAYACSAAYPRPVAIAQPDSYNVLLACASTCQAVNKACMADLTLLNLAKILPDCEATIPGTELYTGGPYQYQLDGSCNAIPFQSTNTTCSSPMTECISPFVDDLVFKASGGQSNTDDDNCSCGCCLPCPQNNAFYKPGILNDGFFITDILKAISAGLALVLAISYIVLPDKLQHPSNLILFAAIATVIFESAVAPSFGDPKRVQCAANGITPATSYNNTLCAIQGTWVLFGAMSTTAWLSIVIVNLHLHTVWNSSWLSMRSWLTHLVGWIIPAAFAAIAAATKSIGWNNSNMCMATEASSNALLFIPLGIMIVPATLLHILTFIHIIKITLESENSETVSHSTLSSGRANRITHRRHVLNAIRIQWRAAVLALVVAGSVLIFWSFYLVSEGNTDRAWMSTWELCIFLKLGNQEQCGDRFAKGNMPNLVFMMVAEVLVSTVGIWIFFLFFKDSVRKEWREYVGGWICCGRRKNRKKEEAEFYVI